MGKKGTLKWPLIISSVEHSLVDCRQLLERAEFLRQRCGLIFCLSVGLFVCGMGGKAPLHEWKASSERL